MPDNGVQELAIAAEVVTHVLKPSAHQAFTSDAYSSAASARSLASTSSRLWQPFVEIFRVDEWHDRISAAREDLYRCLYARQDVSQCFELRRVRLDVAHRFSESIAFERGQVVLASGIANHIPLERLDNALDNRTSTESSIRFEVGRKHPFPQRLAELKRDGGTAGTDDEAEETTGVCRRRE